MNKPVNTLLLLAFSFQLLQAPAFAQTNDVYFTVAEMATWEVEEFSDLTQYQITEFAGKAALQAISNNSASGLVKKLRIDLFATPYLNWHWASEQPLNIANEQTKTGDDFIARIYLVIDGGFKFWQTQSLSYVWSSNQNEGTAWPNPFAENNVKMLAVRGKEANMQQWYVEKRSVFQDLITAFGDCGSDKANEKAYRYIDAIAIMTDTDNSASKATSYYGQISFTSE